MSEVILDALVDSAKILAVVVVFQFLIAFIESKLSDKIKLNGSLAPLIGVSVSLLPQCGFSIVATDLYQKRHLTLGTLIGVYLATSDEALPIFLANPDKALHVLPLLGLKFALGLIFGYLIDAILINNRKKVAHHVEHCDEHYKIRLTDCDGAEVVPPTNDDECVEKCDCDDCKECNHIHKEEQVEQNVKPQKEKSEKEEKLDRFLFHPIKHSLEIFGYVFVVNVILGVIMYRVGEDALVEFLTTNKYLAPLFAVLVGAIPNCVSSVVLSELYVMGGLGFGATLGGLCMNAGLGFVYLFKDVKHTKHNLAVFGLMFVISIAIAYLFSLAFSFDVLPF